VKSLRERSSTDCKGFSSGVKKSGLVDERESGMIRVAVLFWHLCPDERRIVETRLKLLLQREAVSRNIPGDCSKS
jgi:hypothetical protein